MGKILPILIALIGLGGGIGAGLALKPEPEIVAINPCGELGPDGQVLVAQSGEPAMPEPSEDEEASSNEFVKMNNQFVVPVISDANVSALVVMSLSLEITAGNREAFYQREPKLRDLFLQILFDHSNTGGFDGAFTETSRLKALRYALLETARNAMGDMVIDVLVTDIVRQDT
jgi:hypothetical protein